eukprot:359305-Chlamydomonas_euryale.AAC.2
MGGAACRHIQKLLPGNNITPELPTADRRIHRDHPDCQRPLCRLRGQLSAPPGGLLPSHSIERERGKHCRAVHTGRISPRP